MANYGKYCIACLGECPQFLHWYFYYCLRNILISKPIIVAKDAMRNAAETKIPILILEYESCATALRNSTSPLIVAMSRTILNAKRACDNMKRLSAPVITDRIIQIIMALEVCSFGFFLREAASTFMGGCLSREQPQHEHSNANSETSFLQLGQTVITE